MRDCAGVCLYRLAVIVSILQGEQTSIPPQHGKHPSYTVTNKSEAAVVEPPGQLEMAVRQLNVLLHYSSDVLCDCCLIVKLTNGQWLDLCIKTLVFTGAPTVELRYVAITPSDWKGINFPWLCAVVDFYYNKYSENCQNSVQLTEMCEVVVMHWEIVALTQ